MNINKQNFIDSVPGTLWRYKRSTAADGFLYLKNNGNPDNLYDYMPSALSDECIIVKLNNIRRVMLNDGPIKHYELLYGVLTTISGEPKIGWLGDWDLGDLKKYNGQ